MCVDSCVFESVSILLCSISLRRVYQCGADKSTPLHSHATAMQPTPHSTAISAAMKTKIGPTPLLSPSLMSIFQWWWLRWRLSVRSLFPTAARPMRGASYTRFCKRGSCLGTRLALSKGRACSKRCFCFCFLCNHSVPRTLLLL